MNSNLVVSITSFSLGRGDHISFGLNEGGGGNSFFLEEIGGGYTKPAPALPQSGTINCCLKALHKGFWMGL